MNVDQPVHLEAVHAEAEAALAKLSTEVTNLPFAIRSAEARLQLARQDLEGKKSVADAIPGRSIQKAQSEYDAATATLEELGQRGPSLQAELKAWQRKCDALHSKLRLKTDETRGLEEAKANVAATQARLLQAELAVESAKLKFERMTIRSPIEGRVLALNAQPGRRLMGINAASERDAATVVSLYDPDQLQVRADVRLEDVGQVQPGQPVRITTAALGKPLDGRVLALTSSADIQKNTLQVKVSIDDPPPVVKPEMLVQVVFQAPQRPDGKSDDREDPLRLLIPREIVEKTENGATVWVADSTAGVARRQTVLLGHAGTDQLVEVTQGLSALDKLIVSGRDGLSDGDR
ncbi:MAG: HlyD family efflux transporter periplasmic adaptor subunit, partial [Pirellulaceae bacterium]